MSVTQEVIADHWEVNKEDIKCGNCEYWSRHKENYCIFWDLNDNKPDEFCSFWSPKKGV